MTDVENSTRNRRLRPRRKTSTNTQTTRNLRKYDLKLGENTAQDKSTTSAQTSGDSPDEKATPPGQLFLCLYCERSFPSKKSLSKHVQRVHNATARRESIKCAFCSYVENDTTNFLNHMLESHPNQYFACGSCFQRFSSSQELSDHFLGTCNSHRLQQQVQPYRSKLRHRVNSTATTQKVEAPKQFDVAGNEPLLPPDLSDVVVSCELNLNKDDVDFEESISMNLILPPCKSMCNRNIHEKRAVIVLDDIQWKHKPSSLNALQRGDTTDQILSRLGVVHRSRGTETSRYWYRHVDESAKFERCFDTTFYLKVANNVQENLLKFLDGASNTFHKEGEPIKTRKSKNNVFINTIEGFPTLLALGQFSRNTVDDLPRAIAPKQKWKWDNTENDKQTATIDDLGIIKNDSHKSKCIVSLFSSLDIWTQLRMRQKYEKTFSGTKTIEKSNTSSKELQQIIESRELPHTSTQIVKYTSRQSCSTEGLDFPLSLGLVPSASECEIKPAVLSGEWARERCYVCCACGEQTQDPKSLSTHYSTHHPQAQANHYEIVGEELLNADIVRHLYVPHAPPVRMQRRYRGSRTCTKCNRHLMAEHLHGHMLECAGDTPVPRRKVRYRPFGVRRRRTRLPQKAIRKQLRKNMRNRRTRTQKLLRSHQTRKSDVGDADTIKKMIADLPAKRHRVSATQSNTQSNSSSRPKLRRERQIQMRLNRTLSENDEAGYKARTAETEQVQRKVTRSKLTQKEGSVKDASQPASQRAKGTQSQNLCPKGKVLKVKITRKTVLRRSGRKSNDNRKRISPVKQDTPASDSAPTETSTSEGALNLSSKILEQSEKNISNITHSASAGSDNSNRRGSLPNDGHSQTGRSNSQNTNGPKNQVPLKHSIASLTATSHVNSNNRNHPYVPTQESAPLEPAANSYHPYTDRRLLIQEEGYAKNIEKPPLSARTDDCTATLKSKSNKPRRGLNDCIAMLKGKLGESPTRSSYENMQLDINTTKDTSMQIHQISSPSQDERMLTSYSASLYPPPPLHTVEYGKAPMMPLDLSGKSTYSSIDSDSVTNPLKVVGLSKIPTPPLCLAPIQSEPLPLLTTPAKSVQSPVPVASPMYSSTSIGASSKLMTPPTPPTPMPVVHPVQARIVNVITPPALHTTPPSLVEPISKDCWKRRIPSPVKQSAPVKTATSMPAPVVHSIASALAHASAMPMIAVSTPSTHATGSPLVYSAVSTNQIAVPPSSRQAVQSHTNMPLGVPTIAPTAIHESVSSNTLPVMQLNTSPTAVVTQATKITTSSMVSIAIIQPTRTVPSVASATTTSNLIKRSSDVRRSLEKTSPKSNHARSNEKAASQRPVFDPTLKIPQYKVRQNTQDNEPKEGPSTKIQSEQNTADLTESTVALLPKEIVEILGTMSAQHRNTLLNALPQVLAKTVKDLKLVVDSKVSKESLISPNKSEIATQTINAIQEQECPREFLNIDTDKFLIDPVTGAIKERPQKDIPFPVMSETRPIINEPPRLDVIDLTAEDEEQEKKITDTEKILFNPSSAAKIPEIEPVLSTNVAVPLVAPLVPMLAPMPAPIPAPEPEPLPAPPPQPVPEPDPAPPAASVPLPGPTLPSNIQSLIHIPPSSVKSKGSNCKTASLRAVRIKSANGKSKALTAKETNSPSVSKPPEPVEVVINNVLLEPNNPLPAMTLTLETTESGLNPASMISPAIQQAEISSTQHNKHNSGSNTQNTSTVENNAILTPQEIIATKKTENTDERPGDVAADLMPPLLKACSVPKTESLHNNDKDVNKVIKYAPSTEPCVTISIPPISVHTGTEQSHIAEKVCLQPVENVQEIKETEETQLAEKPEISTKMCVQKNENKPPLISKREVLNVEKVAHNVADEDDPEDDVSLAVIVKQKRLKDTKTKRKKKTFNKKCKKQTKHKSPTICADEGVSHETIQGLSESHANLDNLPAAVKCTGMKNIDVESAKVPEKELVIGKRVKKVTIKSKPTDQFKKDALSDNNEDISEEYASTPSSSPLSLRRSRRRKSVITEMTSHPANEMQEVIFPAATIVENKLPLTKKQLIFSKLLDEKKTQDLKLKDLANSKSVNVIDLNTFHGELLLGYENTQKTPLQSNKNIEKQTLFNAQHAFETDPVQETKKSKKDNIKKPTQSGQMVNNVCKDSHAEVSEKQPSISLKIPFCDDLMKSTEIQSTVNKNFKLLDVNVECNKALEVPTENHTPVIEDIHTTYPDQNITRVSEQCLQDEITQTLVDDTKKKTKNKKGKKKASDAQNIAPGISLINLESPVTSSTDGGEIVQPDLTLMKNYDYQRDFESEPLEDINDPPEQFILSSTEDNVPAKSDTIPVSTVPAKKRKKDLVKRNAKHLKTVITKDEDNKLNNNKEQLSFDMTDNKPQTEELTHNIPHAEQLPIVEDSLNTDVSITKEPPKKRKSYLKRKCEAFQPEKETVKENVSDVKEPENKIEKSAHAAPVIDTYEFTEDDFNINSTECDNLEYTNSKKNTKSNLKRKSSPTNTKKQKCKKGEILDRPFCQTEEARSKVSMPKTQLEADVFSNPKSRISEPTLHKEDSADGSSDFLYSSDLTSELSYGTRRTRSKSVLFKTVTATSPQDFDILGPVCDNIEFTNNYLDSKDKDTEATPSIEKMDSEEDLPVVPKVTKPSKRNSKKSKIKKDKYKKQKHSIAIADLKLNSTEVGLSEENLRQDSIDQSAFAAKVEEKSDIPLALCKTTEAMNDSDDSSKSDVPLNKYVKDAPKKKSDVTKPTENTKIDKGKGGPSAFIKNRRKTIAVSLPTPPRAPETVEQQTKSDQFMESFGFFSERKPRKSNLLAAKKIFETFHVNGNDSDDVSYREQERVSRKHPKETSKTGKNSISIPSTSHENTTEDDPPPLKKKSSKEDVKSKATRNAYCTICRKHFRRPDNLVRHQLTLLHVSNLSALEQNLKPYVEDEPPNCLVVYGRHLDRLRMMQKREGGLPEGGVKRGDLPTLSELLQMLPPAKHSCNISERNLSGDEALFYECCELLKESHKHKVLESQPSTSDGKLFATETEPCRGDTSAPPSDFCATTSVAASPSPHATQRALDTDEDVDSITAKEILESEEVRNLENDLLSGLKKVSSVNNFNEETMSSIPDTTPPSGPYDFTSDEETKMAEMRISRYNSDKERIRSRKRKAKSSTCAERERDAALRREIERLQSLPSTSTGIYHETDLFEDKFDKIKRKCRSQSAAARNAHLSLESYNSGKPKKKTEKKLTQKKSAKKLRCSVPTKGALKGFDGIKVSIPTSDIKLPVAMPSTSSKAPKKKKKKTHSKKSFMLEEEPVPPPMVHKTSSSTMTPKNKVDVYEFMDEVDDSDTIEFRPTSLSERIKSAAKTQSLSHGVTLSDTRDMDDSEESPSDGDDFVYMSDDYMGSANETETENSLMSCELGNGGKALNDSKKFGSKRKNSVEKNTVMDKIFKNNAVRNERRDCSRDSAVDSLEKTNLDQLFDSLLEKEPDSFAEREESDRRGEAEIERGDRSEPAEECEREEREGGVARQRARRKCTVGKQNILAETWSSESEQETGFGRRAHGLDSTVGATRKRKSKKASSMATGARDPRKPRHITFKEDDEEERTQSEGTGPPALHGAAAAGPAPGPSYYCSEEEETRLVEQHGWIVGDSHKKLVTMLAHAKGRKRDDKRHFLE